MTSKGLKEAISQWSKLNSIIYCYILQYNRQRLQFLHKCISKFSVSRKKSLSNRLCQKCQTGLMQVFGYITSLQNSAHNDLGCWGNHKVNSIKCLGNWWTWNTRKKLEQRWNKYRSSWVLAFDYIAITKKYQTSNKKTRYKELNTKWKLHQCISSKL